MEEIEEELKDLGLTSYEARVLTALVRGGEMKASRVAELGEVPRPKVYTALDALAERGLVEKLPGNPNRYRSKGPKEVASLLERGLEEEYRERRRGLEDVASRFEEMEEPTGDQEELLHLVNVGEPSLAETRRLYRGAEREIDVATKAMEYLPEVEDCLREVPEEVEVKVLFLDPGELGAESREVQEESREALEELGASVRFSEGPLPLRGSVVDASMEYREGGAILVVEEKEVPLGLRDAAVTENPSLVAGMKRYFDLTWRYESAEDPLQEYR